MYLNAEWIHLPDPAKMIPIAAPDNPAKTSHFSENFAPLVPPISVVL
jgi:hypothetical protein